MKKRLLSCILLLVMAVGMLAACNEGGKDDPSADVSEGETFFGFSLPENIEKYNYISKTLDKDIIVLTNFLK